MADRTGSLASALADRYRIGHMLGAGGMATVYLAQDMKHDRKVAIKVLRSELAAVIGAERFLAEIRTTANLQHPHILPLFDSGAAGHPDNGTFLFYVMPYVEGETLRDRLSREKQLPISDAVRIASEIASALDYAHRHGVIHRDIKPENILLHDGQALVADFGIALAASKAGGGRMTETGMSLGTPHYMSPEQAMGEREITARSDVYALGALTYEMLAGDPPFTGSTAQAIVAKVMTDEPAPLRRHRKTIPEHVEEAVLTALEKLPADRWSSAAEFAQVLAGHSGPTRGHSSARFVSHAGAAPSGKRSVVLLGAALVLMSLVALWGWSAQPAGARTAGVIRFVVTLPASEQIGEAPDRMVAFAPDGSGFVYVGVGPNGRRLYLRRFESFQSRPLPGTEDASGPFFSPDGRWVGFRAGGKLRKVALAGGPPVTIADDPSRGPTWASGGHVIYARTDSPGLWSVPENGGTPTVLTELDTVGGQTAHAYPHTLPNGDLVLTIRTRDGTQIGVARRGNTRANALFPGRMAVYAATGHLVFLEGDSLRAIGYDLSKRRIIGEPFTIEHTSASGGSSTWDFALAQSGALLTVGTRNSDRQLVEVDRSGRELVLSPEGRVYDGPRYSPDGRRIAVRILEEDHQIWTFDIARENFLRLTFGNRISFFPEWSADGRRILYTSEPSTALGGSDLYWTDADGGGVEEALYAAPGSQWEGSFAFGDWLVFRQNDSVTGRDLWALSLRDRRAVPLLVTPHDERAPQFSPDGKLLAYVSDQSGTAEVYVRTFPDSSGTWLVSQGGGTEPAWSPDGRELYYRSGDRLMAVPITTRPRFSAGPRAFLFAGPYVPNATHTNYDVHPAGNRFVMVRSSESERQVVIALNWLEELGNRTADGHD